MSFPLGLLLVLSIKEIKVQQMILANFLKENKHKVMYIKDNQ